MERVVTATALDMLGILLTMQTIKSHNSIYVKLSMKSYEYIKLNQG